MTAHFLKNIKSWLPKCTSIRWEWEEDNRPGVILEHLGNAEVRIEAAAIKAYGPIEDCFEWIVCNFGNKTLANKEFVESKDCKFLSDCRSCPEPQEPVLF